MVLSINPIKTYKYALSLEKLGVCQLVCVHSRCSPLKGVHAILVNPRFENKVRIMPTRRWRNTITHGCANIGDMLFSCMGIPNSVHKMYVRSIMKCVITLHITWYMWWDGHCFLVDLLVTLISKGKENLISPSLTSHTHYYPSLTTLNMISSVWLYLVLLPPYHQH